MIQTALGHGTFSLFYVLGYAIVSLIRISKNISFIYSIWLPHVNRHDVNCGPVVVATIRGHLVARAYAIFERPATERFTV